MKKVYLGQTKIEVSYLGFGVLTVGPWQLNLPLAEGAKVIRHALEKGFTFFDTAQYYQTYPYLKEALKGWHRDVVISTKSYANTYDEMREALEEAREELDRDTIDIFLLHELGSKEDWENRRGAWDYLKEAKMKGLIKAIGISTHHIDMVHLASAIPEIEIIHPLINIKGLGIRYKDTVGKREDMALAIENAKKAGKSIFAMKVFGGGNLISDYREAFDYVKNLAGVDAMMIGFGSKEEVDSSIQLLEGSLREDYHPNLKNKRVRVDRGDCVGCGVCVLKCPNKALFIDSDGLASIHMELCIKCGYCAPVCNKLALIMY